MSDESKTRKKGVLFLCTGNACRSQIAEGFAKSIAPADVPVFSAGTFPAGLISRTVMVMKEIGIDISEQYSKHIEEVPLDEIVTVITLCSSADIFCPSLPNKKKLHWPIMDPVGTIGNEKEVLQKFREARDEIMEKIEKFFKNKEYEDK